MDAYDQQGTEPLFPDLLWSRPENKYGAGKLLIIGGQAQEFSNVAACYASAEQAGAGTVRVIMPDSTEKVTRMLPNIEYAPSNPSGSFSRAALASFLEASAWADRVLLAGDLGKNSETTTILDGYLLKCPAAVMINQDALQAISLPFRQLLDRPIILTLDFAHLQKLGISLDLEQAITSTMNQGQLAKVLHEITSEKKGSIICMQNNFVWVSSNGRVCVSKTNRTSLNDISATSAVWAMQQPAKLYEALVTSLVS